MRELSVVVVAMLICCSPWVSISARAYRSVTTESRTLSPGVWGGDHIRMAIGRDNARLEFDCATGTIDQQIVLDDAGKFAAKGSYTPEHGGPRRDERDSVARARYAGEVHADTMTLTVTPEAGSERVGRYTLTRGNDPLLTKCR